MEMHDPDQLDSQPNENDQPNEQGESREARDRDHSDYASMVYSTGPMTRARTKALKRALGVMIKLVQEEDNHQDIKSLKIIYNLSVCYYLDD